MDILLFSVIQNAFPFCQKLFSDIFSAKHATATFGSYASDCALHLFLVMGDLTLGMVLILRSQWLVDEWTHDSTDPVRHKYNFKDSWKNFFFGGFNIVTI